MKFGLNQEQYEYIIKEVVEPLQDYNAQIWCYGSRARGDHQKMSDLDLMIEANNYNEALSAKASEIKETLVASNFPYKVDLVLFNEFSETYLDSYRKDKVLFN